MKLLCFSIDNKPRLGLKLPQGVIDLAAAGYARNLAETIRDFASVRAELEALSGGTSPLLDEKKLDYLPPASPTSKLLCVGQNYKLHVEEINKQKDLALSYPKEPVLFSKFNNALNGHNRPVVLSANDRKYDYEAELVIVMGKGGMDIPREKVTEYIFGYTCGNDVSARGAQRKSTQWLIGKSFPGFAPCGPWIVTADEIENPCNLAITCRRGGATVQSDNTGQMIFDIYTIVSYASKYICFEPGDLIFTGTPSGVVAGYDADRQKWLAAGDEVTVSIERIGDLTSRFV